MRLEAAGLSRVNNNSVSEKELKRFSAYFSSS